MTDEEAKIAAAFRQCANVRLPDGFADRLARSVCPGREPAAGKPPRRTAFAGVALAAAALTLLFGFIPMVVGRPDASRDATVARRDALRPAGHALPSDGQLNALAFLGFCRDVLRRRVRLMPVRSRRREDEEPPQCQGDQTRKEKTGHDNQAHHHRCH